MYHVALLIGAILGYLVGVVAGTDALGLIFSVTVCAVIAASIADVFRVEDGKVVFDRATFSAQWGKKSWQAQRQEWKDQAIVMGPLMMFLGGGSLYLAATEERGDSVLIAMGIGLLGAGGWTARTHLARWIRDATPVRVASPIATIGVIVGFADLPNDYYILLRLCLSVVSLFLLFGAKLALEDWHRWALGGLAVLYNPVLPVRIGDKGLWEILNVATVIVFWMVSVRANRS